MIVPNDIKWVNAFMAIYFDKESKTGGGRELIDIDDKTSKW